MLTPYQLRHELRHRLPPLRAKNISETQSQRWQSMLQFMTATGVGCLCNRKGAASNFEGAFSKFPFNIRAGKDGISTSRMDNQKKAASLKASQVLIREP